LYKNEKKEKVFGKNGYLFFLFSTRNSFERSRILLRKIFFCRASYKKSTHFFFYKPCLSILCFFRQQSLFHDECFYKEEKICKIAGFHAWNVQRDGISRDNFEEIY
jgi:hypothetical protein